MNQFLNDGDLIELDDYTLAQMGTLEMDFHHIPDTNLIVRNVNVAIDRLADKAEDDALADRIRSIKQADTELKLEMLGATKITFASGDISAQADLCKEVCKTVSKEVKKRVCNDKSCEEFCKWVKKNVGGEWIDVKICKEICKPVCEVVTTIVEVVVCEMICPPKKA